MSSEFFLSASVVDEGHQVQPQAEQRLSPQEVALAVLQTRC